MEIGPRHRVELLAIAAVDDVMLNATDGSGDVQDNQSVGLAGVRLRSQWSSRWSSNLVASYARSHIDAVVNGRTHVDGSDRSKEVEWRVRAEARRAVRRGGEVMLGAAMKHADLDFNLHANAFRNEYNVLVPALNAVFPYAFSDIALYAQARLPAFGRLEVTPGVRVDRAGATRQWYTSPRINAELGLTDAVRLRGALGIYRQSMPYIWIGSDVRNAQLDPVRSTQATGELLIRLPAHVAGVLSVFSKRYDGYPVDLAQPWRPLVSASSDYDSPFVGRLSDAGRVRAKGLDASASRVFARRFRTGLSYSFWRVQQVNNII